MQERATATLATAAVGTPVVGRRELLITAALIFLWLAATAWMRPLALPDEGRYVGVAWEMMTSGDWLTPTLNGLPFFHKPPLFYWITGASMSVFGVNEWAARAAPLMGAWLCSYSLYVFARRWWGERAAQVTLAALVVQPLLYIGGQYANLDMLVAGCICATILLLAHASLNREQGLPYRRTLLGAYAMAALGVLSKGLIGFALPAMVILAWLVAQRRWRTLGALFSLPGAVVFLLVAAPWFVAMQLRFPDFLDYFFVVQHFKRFAGSGFNNVQPFWFYPAVLALLSLPGLPWLASQVRSAPGVNAPRGDIRLLMWLWVGVITLFFSLPKSKLLGYILPTVAPLALLTAQGYLNSGPASVKRQRAWAVSLLLSALVSLATIGYFTLHPRASSQALAKALVRERGALEPVYMLHRFDYDLPFYAQLKQPMRAVNEWDNPEIRQGDDGRKELLDAGQFVPAIVNSILITPPHLAAAVCNSPVSWLVGRPDMPQRYAFLQHAKTVFSQGDATLWRLDLGEPGVAQSLDCALKNSPAQAR